MQVEKILQENFPSLYLLIKQTDQNFSWRKINRSFSKHVKNAHENLLESGPFMKDINLFSLLIEKLHGNGRGDAMLDFFDKLFISLDNNLTHGDKRLLHNNFNSILTNNDKSYIDFIGELATLNGIIKSGKYNLKGVEYPIIEGKNVTSDFLLEKKGYNREIYLEVLNIHLYEKEFHNDEEIKYHLDSKYKIKKASKIITLDKDILIQPVLWTKSEKQLKQLSDFHFQNLLDDEFILPPLAYSSWAINGEFEHRFENISTIFED